MPELVLRETKDSIAVLTMNRPEAMNALSMALRAELAAAVRAALDGATPGFAARWRALAARVHVVDHRGRTLALAGAGDLARGLTITDAVAFAVAPDDALGPVAAPAPDAAGRTITAADVVAAADHRG